MMAKVRLGFERSTQVLAAAAGVVAAVVVAVAWAASPAAAHGGPASLEVVSADEAGPLAVDFVISLTYDGDGHGVDDAQVTVVAEGPEGSVPPVTMERTDDEGKYAGRVVFPSAGEWTMRFTSVEPEATLEVAQVVVAGATTTTVASGGSSTTDAVSGIESTTTVEDSPTTTATPDSVPVSGEVGSVDAEQGDGPLWLALGVVAVAVIAGLIAVRRRGSEDDDAAGASGPASGSDGASNGAPDAE